MHAPPFAAGWRLGFEESDSREGERESFSASMMRVRALVFHGKRDVASRSIDLLAEGEVVNRVG